MPSESPDRQSDKLSLDEVTKGPLEGWLGRNAILAVSGKFVVDSKTMKDEIKKTGSLGGQIADSMGQLEKDGWKVKHSNIFDLRSRIWNGTPTGKLDLSSLQFSLQGGSAVETRGLIEVNVLKQILFSSLGHAPDASKYGAAIAAHECSHVVDGILRYLPDASTASSRAGIEKEVLAKRFLATEARANLVGATLWQRLGAKDGSFDGIVRHVQDGDAYKCVYNDVYKRAWPVLNNLNEKQARLFVNDYFHESFGSNLIDEQTRRIKDFDFRGGLSKQIGTLHDDSIAAQTLAKVRQDVLNQKNSLASLMSDSGAATNLRRACHTAGFVGATLACTDIVSGFNKSTACGIGKVERVALNATLFQIGARLGSLVPNPIGTVVGAFSLPLVVDLALGQKLEQTTSRIAQRYFLTPNTPQRAGKSLYLPSPIPRTTPLTLYGPALIANV